MILLTVSIALTTVLLASNDHTQNSKYGVLYAAGSSNSSLIFGYSNATYIPNNDTSLSTTPDPCIRSAEIQIHSITSSFNITKATALANKDTAFNSRIEGYTPTFDSNFDIWDLNKTNCTITWKTTNLVYDLRNTTSVVKRIIVTEDSAITRVLNITGQSITGHFSNVLNASNWSGYEFAGDGNIPPATQMYASESTFNVPAISIPTYPSNACRTDIGHLPCVLANWVGLEDKSGATDNILAQTGAAENITCASSTSCSTKYSIWYEFLAPPSFLPPVYCTGLGQVNSTDSITVNVYMDTLVGGKDSSVVDILTEDNTNLHANVCSIKDKFFNSTTPVYSSFINEDPFFGTMPKFNNVQMTQNTVNYNNGYRFVSQPYSNGWYNEWNFFHNNDTSITNHDLTGENFTETWNTICSPTSGTWTVSQTCTLNNNYNASGNIIVQNAAVLRIPWGITLKNDFSLHNLQINSGGGVLIDGLNNPNHPTWPGGSIKCLIC
jgi:hypothetical protein